MVHAKEIQDDPIPNQGKYRMETFPSRTAPARFAVGIASRGIYRPFGRFPSVTAPIGYRPIDRRWLEIEGTTRQITPLDGDGGNLTKFVCA